MCSRSPPQAKEWCIGTSRCAGFTSEVPYDASACAKASVSPVLDLHFLDDWAISRTGSNTSWTHWRAPPPMPPTLQIFAKPMTPATKPDGKGAGGRRVAVAVLNRGPTVANVTVEWSMLSSVAAKWARSLPALIPNTTFSLPPSLLSTYPLPLARAPALSERRPLVMFCQASTRARLVGACRTRCL